MSARNEKLQLVEDMNNKNLKLENQININKEQININKELNKEVIELNNTIDSLKTDIGKLRNMIESNRPTRGITLNNSREFTVTCYDLSVQSCGKPIGSKGYGITASGESLVGKTWESARAIAVDTKVIPLGSKVKVKFKNNNYRKYDGIYTAVDTGGAIKGNKIDFFMGDFNQNETHQSVWDFGKTKANIEVIK